MSEKRHSTARFASTNPWLIDIRDLGRRAGSSYAYRTAIPAAGLGLAGVIEVPPQGLVDLDVMLESVVEGVLVTGTASTTMSGECSRCLDEFSEDVEVSITELFAYQDSMTDRTADEFEIARLVDDLIDLEQVVRDAIVLALPQAPLCSPNCPGLCIECGGKLAELGPDHQHETIDPRWAALHGRLGDTHHNQEEK
jgi:uncharacterized protein